MLLTLLINVHAVDEVKCIAIQLLSTAFKDTSPMLLMDVHTKNGGGGCKAAILLLIEPKDKPPMLLVSVKAKDKIEATNLEPTALKHLLHMLLIKQQVESTKVNDLLQQNTVIVTNGAFSINQQVEHVEVVDLL
ncbi:hypothetical protein AMAG_02870 [Allomyces macrogynus ATCC 38327]|uniref:Uncharacterized protein n=1 Tax=Allomyces macrogynus (strain ATCC 38327) TaxID=578462 RepID=A0A0L0S3Y5_ALLM3|nr:hypothetical protein AMAG_02870 [Allomyces macrogynus ATCC 38327]|eukprot:KNE57120.1 hypothetical protein AMAG_02870 [Allomyces macrogynus ATCC 38327]